MVRKMVKFTDKAKNETKVMLVGTVGSAVFALTKDVKETNDAIKWCTKHEIGDTFDCERYTITLEEERPVGC